MLDTNNNFNRINDFNINNLNHINNLNDDIITNVLISRMILIRTI